MRTIGAFRWRLLASRMKDSFYAGWPWPVEGRGLKRTTKCLQCPIYIQKLPSRPPPYLSSMRQTKASICVLFSTGTHTNRKHSSASTKSVEAFTATIVYGTKILNNNFGPYQHFGRLLFTLLELLTFFHIYSCDYILRIAYFLCCEKSSILNWKFLPILARKK